ncbi:iron chelate uptake ABC transporter family permease subunit [Pontibacter qinzhouensis]|uniref:Iron chelate uptake ABC transporter family permease subunit n=1 Tax=Pontibacter qinzhouensis TaxID=2603253 RepID=A0A5C8J270_9BACT|nr:iron chelate uptake ABC transporter family permease subunit [Pontibacter qinzhouensis]TXK28415.1 iron chelate uptake ABC transporter family permease subunit [Pontibacter qinzhouensis]
MSDFTEFFSFTDANVRFVAIGSVLLASSSAVVGCFTLLRKRALVGDAVAHAVLPGVCLAFMLSGTKNPLVLLLGAFITGWLSLIVIDFITSRSRIKEDTAIGLVLSVFFGIGILLLTSIQHSGNAAQSGLDKFLFGNAAALIGEDLIVFSVVALLLLVCTVVFYKELMLLCFDEAYARTIGYPVRALELLLTTLTVFAVVVGIQAVGVVLMAAMLITPAAAARFWTENLRLMLVLAALMGAFSGLAGAYVSYTAPSMPTGPWIVLIISMIAISSFAFAPGKGWVSRIWKQRRNKARVLEENLLKLMYQLGEPNQDYYSSRNVTDIMERRQIPKSEISKGLRKLKREGYVVKDKNAWVLTRQGQTRGMRVVRLHRLWELYLTQFLELASDHVHEDAETIEHIITPELEQKLMQELQYPVLDPHNNKIP